ncbi:amidase [Roseomonas sp. HF4]|uniref:amidase n=1 Tax=Roseomonas sp. HF4 TaxID=2562313 RepID=UPI0010BFA1D1|nr:amidase [Roseomonas sp. HF4]
MTRDECLAAIAARDGAVHAVWHLDPVATGGAGPLAGVPVLVKDNIAVAGMPWTAGLAAHRDRIAGQDAPCVAALRTAGAIILGKVALHEGALGATTSAPRRCDNPLAPGFTPGGSSGGSGAAVAAGFAPLAIGTDTMGSVRIPAAYCGVVGFKPTAGLVGRSLVTPLSSTLDTVGMVARTLREAALGLAAMVTPDAADPGWIPAPAGWTARPGAAADLRMLRLGLPAPAWDAPMEVGLRDSVEAVLDRLRASGATLERIAMPGWLPRAARRAGLLVTEAEAALDHAAIIDDPAAASEGFRAALRYGRDAGAIRLARAFRVLAEARSAALRALATCDVLLMPTAPQRAFAHGAPVPDDQADFTALANIAGLPAISFPCAAPDGGLPGSLQLVGPAWSEARLVAIAEAISAP